MKIPTFLKWVGGKRRLLTQIDLYLPEKIDRYFEPFLGGGSMFFYIKQKYNPKYCLISDINEDLINAYIHVKDNPRGLIKSLDYFRKRNSKDFYYTVRKKFNEGKFSDIKKSAAFIYMNKTCFNGVYRVNKKNEFNVPYGNYKDRAIYNKKDILLASELLQGAVIKKQSYEEILPKTKKGDLVYLDPCYDPLKRTSFVQYTPDRFSLQDRFILFKFISELRNRQAFILLSNNDLDEVRNLYELANFKVNTVETCRTVNSNILERGRIPELLITN